MTRLIKGALRTVVNNEEDVKSYLQAGWSIATDEVVKEEPAKKEITIEPVKKVFGKKVNVKDKNTENSK